MRCSPELSGRLPVSPTRPVPVPVKHMVSEREALVRCISAAAKTSVGDTSCGNKHPGGQRTAARPHHAIHWPEKRRPEHPPRRRPLRQVPIRPVSVTTTVPCYRLCGRAGVWLRATAPCQKPRTFGCSRGEGDAGVGACHVDVARFWCLAAVPFIRPNLVVGKWSSSVQHVRITSGVYTL